MTPEHGARLNHPIWNFRPITTRWDRVTSTKRVWSIQAQVWVGFFLVSFFSNLSAATDHQWLLHFQIEELIIAEAKSCCMNLNNVESKYGMFIHISYEGHTTSSLQMNSASIDSPPSFGDDVMRRKENVDVMPPDICNLLKQLESLSVFTFSDPFLLVEPSVETAASLSGDLLSLRNSTLGQIWQRQVLRITWGYYDISCKI